MENKKISFIGEFEIKDKHARHSKIERFKTVKELKDANHLESGMVVETLGYYNINDGGGAFYYIRERMEEEVIDNGMIIPITVSLVAELIIKDSINSRQFGAVGDGVTLDDEALQNFLNCEAPIHEFIKGNYLIDSNLNVKDNTYINFLNGAKITRKPTTSGTYFMLNVGNVKNVTINNAHLIGEKDSHLATDGEWGYGIHVFSSQNINIFNTTVENTWGDGIYIGYSYGETNVHTPKNIVVDNCRILNCSRNGVSLCSGENIKVLNTYINGVKRTNPKSAIDIEPEGPNSINPFLKNVLIDNVTSENNGYGIVVANEKGLTIDNLIITNHTSINETVGYIVFADASSGYKSYENGKIIKPQESGIQITKANTSELLIKDTVIDSTTKENQQHSWNGAVVIVSTTNSGNLTLDNVEYVENETLSYTDFLCVRGEGTFSNLTLKNIFTTKYMSVATLDLSSLKVYNCKFISNTPYYMLSYDKYSSPNIIEVDEFAAYTTRSFDTTLPDGDYEVYCGNVGMYNMTLTFADGFTVFDSNLPEVHSKKNYVTTMSGSYLKFKKLGNNIFVKEKSQYWTNQ